MNYEIKLGIARTIIYLILVSMAGTYFVYLSSSGKENENKQKNIFAKIFIWSMLALVLMYGLIPAVFDVCLSRYITRTVTVEKVSSFPPGMFFLDQKIYSQYEYFHLLFYPSIVVPNKKYQLIYLKSSKFVIVIKDES